MYDANDMLTFIRKAIQTRSFSDEEGEMAELLKAEMLRVGFDEEFHRFDRQCRGTDRQWRQDHPL